MNGNSNGMERTQSDFVLFGLVFFGIIIVTSGLVGTSLGLAIVGGLVTALGVGGFLLKQFLGE